MNQTIEMEERELVSCKVCLTEVPQSEASVPEAEGYVSYFCGLECYALWKKQSEFPAEKL
ncbi:MAG: DUF3330 domain-containing protein [Gallionella sp.]